MQKTLLLMLVFTAISVSQSAYDHASSQSTEREVLSRRLSTMQSLHADIVGTFESALSSTGVPGGVAVVTGCEAPSKKILQVSNGSLRKVLESLVRADPRYHWFFHDGVANLIPAEGIPPLLKVRINTLEVTEPANMWMAASTLLKLPEVREAESRLGLMQSFAGSVLGSMGGKTPTHPKVAPVSPLHLHNVSIFEALNAIVRANKKGVWIFNESYCRGKGVFNVSFSQ